MKKHFKTCVCDILNHHSFATHIPCYEIMKYKCKKKRRETTESVEDFASSCRLKEIIPDRLFYCINQVLHKPAPGLNGVWIQPISNYYLK